MNLLTHLEYILVLKLDTSIHTNTSPPLNTYHHITIMTTELAPRSPHMITAVSLLELAEQVSTAASSISQHLRSKSLNEPDFSPTSPGLPEDSEIRDARESLLVASKALTVLATNPVAHIRDVLLAVSTLEGIVPPFIHMFNI